MYKALAFVFLAITLITTTTTSPRGGRGGGGGKSSGGSRGSLGSIGSGSNTFTGSHTSQHPSSGWFHGIFHTPYHYTYTPSHTNRMSSNSYQLAKEEETGQHKDTENYAVGDAISKSLSGDFFSIFNMVHDISKIPNKIKNKEFLPATTTIGPVSTYNFNDIIDNPNSRSHSNMVNSMQSTDYNVGDLPFPNDKTSSNHIHEENIIADTLLEDISKLVIKINKIK